MVAPHTQDGEKEIVSREENGVTPNLLYTVRSLCWMLDLVVLITKPTRQGSDELRRDLMNMYRFRSRI